jgi:Transcription factor WhiB
MKGRVYRSAAGKLRPPMLVDVGPAFLTDPRRGCAPEKLDDPDTFYPDTPAGRARAIKICKTECPFWHQCDSYATTHRERWGVWGGKCRDRRLVPVEDQRVHDLWRKRMTPAQIADVLGCTSRAVTISCKRQGLFVPEVDA